MMTLDLAIATHRADGIRRVARMLLPPTENISYVISWQDHQDAPIPAEMIRPDVKVYRFDTKGQSLNRNNAIEHCTANIILHSDDDLIYDIEGLKSVITTFENNPQVDVATFRTKSSANRIYPLTEVQLCKHLPKGYSVGTIEIAFRRSTAGFLRCCPEFGLASSQLHGGEDEMFLMSAIRRKLNCRFFPITICEHPGESTGSKSRFSNENLQAFGCVIAMNYPCSAILRIPLKAWRIGRTGQASFIRALSRLVRGAMMAPGVLKRNHKYLW